MADIFISYASQDRSRVVPFVQRLEAQGWSVLWDRTIPPGKTFDEVIESAINDAKCVVVLWSQASIKSGWVKEEASIGKRRGILIPAKIDPVEPPLGFGLIQAADLTDLRVKTSHAEFEGFLRAISDIVGFPPQREKGDQVAEIPGSIFEQLRSRTTFARIGAGGITGVYYPIGGAIAKMVNKKRKEYGIRATVESTGGSVFNVNAVMTANLDFGVVQSDRQYEAVQGMADWLEKGPQKDLRAVFSIHPVTVNLIAAVDANINSLQDLKGKRVNIGNIGTGYRQNAIDALTANGLDYEKDFYAENLKAPEAPKLIQDGRIDAAFYTVGHPSGYYIEATSGVRKVKFVPIMNIESLLEKYPYYVKAVTRVKELYPGAVNEADVPTFGVKVTFVTSAKVPDDAAYAITKEVFDNFKSFKKLHPVLTGLTKENMLEGMSAPIHPGAMKYYKEAGLK